MQAKEQEEEEREADETAKGAVEEEVRRRRRERRRLTIIRLDSKDLVQIDERVAVVPVLKLDAGEGGRERKTGSDRERYIYTSYI